jgi:hypothetical protein
MDHFLSVSDSQKPTLGSVDENMTFKTGIGRID